MTTYIRRARRQLVTYSKNNPNDYRFFGTCNAVHIATHDHKGIKGWSFHHQGGAVAWKSRTQDIVSLSSTESELIAVDEATRELRFLHKLLLDFNVGIPLPTPIAQDNTSTITLVKSKHFNARTKHVALRYHHTAEQQERGVLQLRYLNTEHVPADVLTKPLPRSSHERHTAVLLGLRPLPWPDRPDLVADAAGNNKRVPAEVCKSLAALFSASAQPPCPRLGKRRRRRAHNR